MGEEHWKWSEKEKEKISLREYNMPNLCYVIIALRHLWLRFSTYCDILGIAMEKQHAIISLERKSELKQSCGD